jgi:hypothetical protein
MIGVRWGERSIMNRNMSFEQKKNSPKYKKMGRIIDGGVYSLIRGLL